MIGHFAETFAPRIGKPDPVADRLGEHVLYRRSLQDELVALEHQRGAGSRRRRCGSAPTDAVPRCGPR